MVATLTLLRASPRTPPGILTRDAWQALERAAVVLAADPQDPQPAAIAQAGIDVTAQDSATPGARARALITAAQAGDVVWVETPDGDPGLTDALAGELTRLPDPPGIEVLVGSWDRAGARLLDAVAVMDALRSPGGCPWDAEQTHESLVRYLIEETYETVEAIEQGNRGHLAEELGDVLLQVLFHARVAAEDPAEPFDIDDVAAGLVDKLVRRHPHVFGDADASTAGQVEARWEQIKAQEMPERDQGDLFAGIPAGLPTLLVAQKILDRAGRRGLSVDLGPDGLGKRMLRLVGEARAGGQAADALLRAQLRQVRTVPADSP